MSGKRKVATVRTACFPGCESIETRAPDAVAMLTRTAVTASEAG